MATCQCQSVSVNIEIEVICRRICFPLVSCKNENNGAALYVPLFIAGSAKYEAQKARLAAPAFSHDYVCHSFSVVLSGNWRSLNEILLKELH